MERTKKERKPREHRSRRQLTESIDQVQTNIPPDEELEPEVKEQEEKKSKHGDKVQFINTGGTFRMRGGKKIIKPGQKFWANPDEVPRAFLDIIKPATAAQAEILVHKIAASYKMQVSEKDSELFNIVDANGKIINEHPMPKEKAEATLARLMV